MVRLINIFTVYNIATFCIHFEQIYNFWQAKFLNKIVFFVHILHKLTALYTLQTKLQLLYVDSYELLKINDYD